MLAKIIKNKELIISIIVFFFYLLIVSTWFLPFLVVDTFGVSITPNIVRGVQLAFGFDVRENLLFPPFETTEYFLFYPIIFLSFLFMILSFLLLIIFIILRHKINNNIVKKVVLVIAILFQITSSVMLFFIPTIFTAESGYQIASLNSGYICTCAVTILGVITSSFYLFI